MNLKDLKDLLHSKYIKYKDYELFLQWVYYIFGGSSVVLLLISSISAGVSKMDTNFYLILTATIINSLIAFFRLNEKMSIIHSYAADVNDISLDIRSYLQSEHTKEEEILFKKMILQIQKRLEDRQPSVSPCFDKYY